MVDTLLLFSFNFFVLYTGTLFITSFFPDKWKIRPNAAGLPLVFFGSALLFFSPWDAFVVPVLSGAVHLIPPYVVEIGGYNEALVFIIVSAVWLAGFLAGIAFLGFKCLYIFRKLKTCPCAPKDRALDMARTLVKPRGHVKVLIHDGSFSPSSWGLNNAVLFVPPDFQITHTVEERYGIYIHELSHLNNRDSYKYMLCECIGIVLWFNPLIWYAIKRYKIHLEVVCDRAVLLTGELTPLVYAKGIVKSFARSEPFLPSFSTGFDEAARRFKYIFSDNRMFPSKKDRKGAMAGMVCILIFLGVFYPFADPPDPTFPAQGSPVIEPDGSVGDYYYLFCRKGILGEYTQTRRIDEPQK